MPTFAELIRKYIERAGITDAELARSIGVRRQTIFRWKEGLVARPRHRDDVMSLAKRLRLTDKERDELLIVAGFAPESMPEVHSTAAGKAKPPVAQETKSEEIPDKEIPDKEIPDKEIPDKEIPDKEIPDKEIPSEKIEEAEHLLQKPIPAATEKNKTKPITVRVSDEEPKPELKPSEPTTRPLWLSVAPIVAILLLVGGLGYWLIRGESTPVPPPESTVITEPARGIRPDPTPAAPGETLLLVALFENYTGDQGYNVAGRIERELSEQTAAASLTDTRSDILNRSILSDADARSTLGALNAALLIWGEFDSGRVVVNLSTLTSDKTESSETHLPTPLDLAPTINTDVPQETRILAMLALGEHFLATGEADQALTVLDKALALNPPTAMQKNLHFQLGRAYNAVQPPQSQQAIDAYTKVLELSPRTANAYYNRGLAYYTLFVNTGDNTNLDLAIADYDNMIQRNPEYVNAYQNRGIAYYARTGEGDFEAALADLDVVVEQQPDSYRGFFNRGLIAIALNKSDQWKTDLLRAKELAEPESYDYVNSLVGLCWGHMLEKQIEDAITNCQEAIDTAPERGDSHDSMGIVHALNGDFDAALEQFSLYIDWLSTKSPAQYERQNGPMVEQWIEQLEAGEQPITDEVLESLRNG